MYRIGDKVKFKKNYYIDGMLVPRDRTFVIEKVNPLGNTPDLHYIFKDYPYMIVLDKELAPAKEKSRIVIEEFYDRRHHGVVAKKYVNDVLVEEGISRCHPEDVFDFNVGVAIAMSRLKSNMKGGNRSASEGINATVRCISSPYFWWRKGGIYKVVDGVIYDDEGDRYPKRTEGDMYRTAEELRHIGNEYQNEKNYFEVLEVY
jgi:hypothetical protein